MTNRKITKIVGKAMMTSLYYFKHWLTNYISNQFNSLTDKKPVCNDEKNFFIILVFNPYLIDLSICSFPVKLLLKYQFLTTTKRCPRGTERTKTLVFLVTTTKRCPRGTKRTKTLSFLSWYCLCLVVLSTCCFCFSLSCFALREAILRIYIFNLKNCYFTWK